MPSSGVKERVECDRPRLVDCHAHVLPHRYVAELGRLARSEPHLTTAARAATSQGMSRLPASCSHHMLNGLSDRLDLLQAAGVDRQILSAGSALAFPLATSYRAELVAAWNDSVHDEITSCARPGAFGVFAGVPLPDVPASIRESRRVAERDTTAGFSITAHVLGESLESDRWHPLFAQWNEMRASVFVHPDRFRVRGLLAPHLEVDAGTQLDDTIVALQLSSGGLGQRFPGIRWIVAHLGGTFTFLLERLDEHWERDNRHDVGRARAGEALDNVWFDTAGHGIAAVRFAVQALGPSRFVFGSDFPMLGEDHLLLAARRVRQAIGCMDGSRQVLSENAERLVSAAERPAPGHAPTSGAQAKGGVGRAPE